LTRSAPGRSRSGAGSISPSRLGSSIRYTFDKEVPMRHRWNATLAIVLVPLAAVLGAANARAQERPGDKGEAPEEQKLKSRATAPAAADMDGSATLDALLAKQDKSAFSESKGATIEGWVVQVEREEDGDVHLALAPEKGGTDAKKWVIVEVPVAWQKKAATLGEGALRKLAGTKVRVTGWLYYEPDPNQPDPRGTRWEIHPVTAIAPAK
jgi:hypothetical protein